MIRYLEWDSAFFKKKIGLFDSSYLTRNEIDTLLTEKAELNYDLVYLFADKFDTEADSFFYKSGISVIDRKVTYAIEKIVFSHDINNIVEPYNGTLTETLLNLTIISGHQSRFKKDMQLNDKFETLYTQWIQKSLTGEMADMVLVANINNKIKGFVTVKKNVEMGQIGLIAVDPAFHGKGIGQMLINTVHNWYYHNGITKATVVTQLDNTGACRLYEKMGYHQESKKLICHIY